MAKLRYGPRTGQGAFTVGARYNETDDRQHVKDTARMLGMLNNQPLHKQQLRHYNTAKTNKKRHAAAAPGPEREEAEQRMAEAVRKCVEILEFHMDDMIQYTQAPNRPRYCLQTHIHNVIYELRHKCGVQFADKDTHYVERVCEDQRRRSEKEIVDDMRSEREQQRLARLRAMKEQAEKFAKWRAK